MNVISEKTPCALQEEGYNKSNEKDYIELIRPAEFFCKNCGRSAVKTENLCNPEKLS